MNIEVSVIIPVYNAENYLSLCIDSVLSQTFSNIEIILVNDGSLDNSAFICDKYEEKDLRVRAIHQNNRGVASARNRGIKEAQGKYLVFVDSDDYIASDMIEKMFIAIDQSDMVINSYIRFNSEGIEIKPKNLHVSSHMPMEILTDLLKNDKFISCCRCLFKKEILDENNIFFTPEIKYGEDQEFTYKYMMNCQNVVYIEDAIYYYRIHKYSAMSNAKYEQFQEIEAIQSVLDYAKTKFSNREVEILSSIALNNRFVHVMKVAVINLLASGENIGKIKNYMKKNGFLDILNKANVEQNKQYYTFWYLWKTSPSLCLNFYLYRQYLSHLKNILFSKGVKK